MSLACGVAVPYLMFTLQRHSIQTMTGVWLLPIVAAEVSAVSGALLVPHLSASDALLVLLLSYALWAFSVPLAMSVLVILLLRLVLYKLPERSMAASGWLALGPIGTAALGLVLLGREAPAVFAATGLSEIGEVAVVAWRSCRDLLRDDPVLDLRAVDSGIAPAFVEQQIDLVGNSGSEIVDVGIPDPSKVDAKITRESLSKITKRRSCTVPIRSVSFLRSSSNPFLARACAARRPA